MPKGVERLAIAALAAATIVAGCTCGGAPEGVVDSCSDGLALPPSITTDILFVIDNSLSMAEEQAKVVRELEAFVNELASAPVKNDFQIGVITTGVTQRATGCDGKGGTTIPFARESGRLQLGKEPSCLDMSASTCGVDPASTDKLLSFDDPLLLDQFALLIQQGIKGSGQEMGLEAVRLALSEPLVSRPLGADDAGNQGFLRPGSRLLVVIVSDEDDCSDPTGQAVALTPPSCAQKVACTTDADCAQAGQYCTKPTATSTERRCVENPCETVEGRAALEPIERYAAFLEGLDDGTGTGRKRDVAVAVIGPVALDAPHVPERCESDSDEAYGEGARYRALVEAMGDRGYVDSICADSYAPALRKIAALVATPQTLDLPESPPDGRLVLVDLTREDGETQTCRSEDGFRFEPAAGRAPARITMEGRCRLRSGDQIGLRLICAG